jgi:molecular chaperone GrpE
MKKTAKDDAENIKKKKAEAAPDADGNLPEINDEKDVSEEKEAKSSGDKKVREKAADDKGTGAELSDMKDRYMRLLAEYDNFRKRTIKERDSLYSDAVAEVAKEWLPVIDNVERAIAYAADNGQQISEGMEKILKQAQEVLAKLGIDEILCERGTCFDPNFHAAVAHIEDDELGEQAVSQVFLKGYKIGERVIRHSLVQTAN